MRDDHFLLFFGFFFFGFFFGFFFFFSCDFDFRSASLSLSSSRHDYDCLGDVATSEFHHAQPRRHLYIVLDAPECAQRRDIDVHPPM